ncbi:MULTISPECIES: energy-coupling factor ABC transporter ATP-binding protein [Kocuria]|uniref:energy-coupling factor ABC transporter ATP-binding protein n=1 Tax=Kocuria TaxID=57493 RepID=UPI00065FDA14|nr:MULTISPECIES: ABC transporter ATP-binding protein [Kocuria]MCT1367403.1 energy-coupling factor ABC transporter ATP-binding protein [Rothia sp. p3-SID1597]RUQ22492.1 ABC transporter ATP-binding protein [Kocuria sp. HSID16901]
MTVNITNMHVRVDGHQGPVTLLEDVTLNLEAPRTAILGENGSGKSTLAKTLAGLIAPAEGAVQVNGIDVVKEVKRLRREVGFVFANPAAQVIMPTVREDIALTLRGRKLSRQEISERVERAIEEHELTSLADRPCHSLSSGQMQRLALCSVLVGEPQLVLADEPTSLLDARHRRIIAERLLKPAAPQVILVTHDLELARRCDEAVLVADGRIEGQGSPEDMIERYEEILG